MKVRYKETGKTDDHVELGDDGQLVGFGDPFQAVKRWCTPWARGVKSGLLYFITPDTFDDWQLVEATDDERRRLRDAGFQV
jgi:hypothetical protein